MYLVFCQLQGKKNILTINLVYFFKVTPTIRKKTELLTVQSVVGERTIENQRSDNNSNRRSIKVTSMLEASISDVRNLDTEFFKG